MPRHRRPAVCQRCEKRPVRRIRGAKWCSPCAGKTTKIECPVCGVRAFRDVTRNGRCLKCASQKAHGSRLVATYNITRDQYDEILSAQGGGCAICGRVLTKRNYCVDHDHACCAGPTSCGRCVRGLICSVDNKYLGYIRDRPEVGDRISQYLQSPPARKVLQ